MDPTAALQELGAPQELTILSIAEPILSQATSNSSNKRSSNASSNDGSGLVTANSLEVELVHYQELFSKLRFSYVEQVTKEKFLTAITSEQPDFVQPEENAELERLLVEQKAALKLQKDEVKGMKEDLETQGRQLALRYEAIQLQTAQLESLPIEIANLQETVSALQSTRKPASSNPSLNLPLPATLQLLSEREAQLAALDAQLETLQQVLPAKKREVLRLESELQPLEARKKRAVQEAQEARRRRENGGISDEIEEKGRWLRSVDTAMRTMLEVDA